MSAAAASSSSAAAAAAAASGDQALSSPSSSPSSSSAAPTTTATSSAHNDEYWKEKYEILLSEQSLQEEVAKWSQTQLRDTQRRVDALKSDVAERDAALAAVRERLARESERARAREAELDARVQTLESALADARNEARELAALNDALNAKVIVEGERVMSLREQLGEALGVTPEGKLVEAQVAALNDLEALLDEERRSKTNLSHLNQMLNQQLLAQTEQTLLLRQQVEELQQQQQPQGQHELHELQQQPAQRERQRDDEQPERQPLPSPPTANDDADADASERAPS